MTKKVITFLVLTATVTLTTMFVAIPVGSGYFNLSDIAVVFTGLFIAHFIGANKWQYLLAAALVTGVGAAMADIFLGWGLYAPATLIAKGLEATFAYLSYNKKGVKHFLLLLIGGILMAATYFVAQAFFLDTLAYAISEIFPTNTIQLLGGIIGGRILFLVASKIIKK